MPELVKTRLPFGLDLLKSGFGLHFTSVSLKFQKFSILYVHTSEYACTSDGCIFIYDVHDLNDKTATFKAKSAT